MSLRSIDRCVLFSLFFDCAIRPYVHLDEEPPRGAMGRGKGGITRGLRADTPAQGVEGWPACRRLAACDGPIAHDCSRARRECFRCPPIGSDLGPGRCR